VCRLPTRWPTDRLHARTCLVYAGPGNVTSLSDAQSRRRVHWTSLQRLRDYWERLTTPNWWGRSTTAQTPVLHHRHHHRYTRKFAFLLIVGFLTVCEILTLSCAELCFTLCVIFSFNIYVRIVQFLAGIFGRILVWCAGFCWWVNGLRGVSRVKLNRPTSICDYWIDSRLKCEPKPTLSWWFDFIWILRNAECGKTLRCNLRDVRQRKFRKIHLLNIPHSAKYAFPAVAAILLYLG